MVEHIESTCVWRTQTLVLSYVALFCLAASFFVRFLVLTIVHIQKWCDKGRPKFRWTITGDQTRICFPSNRYVLPFMAVQRTSTFDCFQPFTCVLNLGLLSPRFGAHVLCPMWSVGNECQNETNWDNSAQKHLEIYPTCLRSIGKFS